MTPSITVNKDIIQAEVIIDNFAGGTVFLERAEGLNGLFEEIATFTTSRYIDEGLDPDINYKYRVTVTDVEGSVLIVGDFTFETPPYYEVEPIAPATFTNIAVEFDIPWTSNITIDLIRISNLRRSKHSRIRY